MKGAIVGGRAAVVTVASPSFSKHPVLREELLAHFPKARFNDAGKRLEGDALVAYLDGADAAIIGLEPMTREVLERLPELKLVAKFGVGLDNVDADACRALGKVIGWTGGVNRRSVSEMTLSFMIGLCRNMFFSSRQLHQGVWNKTGGYQLSGKTVGIIGVGNIGQDLVPMLKPFDCRVLVNDIEDRSALCQTYGCIEASKEQIFRESHIVTLHVPMTAQTANLINAESLKLFRPDAFLINTARGGVVDQLALKEALKTRRLAGAAIDVYADEPVTDDELLGLPNLVCTPHIGGNAIEAVLAMGRSAIEHAVRVLGEG